MKPTRNLWPYAIIATFVIFVSGTIGLVVMACSQKVDLVNDNYYEQEIKYQNHIDSAERARNLGAAAVYDIATRRIVVTLPPRHAGKDVNGRIDLYRPSAAGMDRQLKLEPDAHGIQLVDATALKAGLWRVRVTWNVAGENFFMERPVVIRLAPNT